MNLLSAEINVNNNKIKVIRVNGKEYISLTDLAKYKNPKEPKDIIKNWMRSKTTLEFLIVWESLNNPKSQGVDFDPLLKEAGTNSFLMSPKKWINLSNSTGIIQKYGIQQGTYAHSDIAFEFASWLSPEFKLYLLTEFQRLKKHEAYNNQIQWDIKRELVKANYKLHTDAIKNNLIPLLSEKDKKVVYPTEADMINKALFGMTAKEWKKNNPNLKGNIRDNTDTLHLIILSNLEMLNVVYIEQKLTRNERLIKLNEDAIKQLSQLKGIPSVKKVEHINENNLN